MRKALIAGSAGFIGTHLTSELSANGYEVICCDIKPLENNIIMDIMNPEMIRKVLIKYEPDIIINMAGQANVGLSWREPQSTVQLNTVGLINVLETVRSLNPKIRVIAVGSSDEYGSAGSLGTDVTEDVPVKPETPYAISKLAQEQFAQLYVKAYGMNICMVRLFNLGGPGQAKGYMISDFSSGIAEMEAGKRDYITVGNLESARDFTHVKDACRAIRLIAESGHTGEVYNISSGVAYSGQEILDKLINMAEVNIDIRQDPARMRPSDTAILCGNHSKLTDHTGWIPECNIDRILEDTLAYWRRIVAR